MKKSDIDTRFEKYVQSDKGLRIEGRQDFYENKQYVKCYTWMRYVNEKTMDDLKRN